MNIQTSLLEIKEAIINSTLKMLKEQNIVKNEIAFLILAYDFAFPFTPEIGLCQSAEVESLLESGSQVLYSPGDMEYFGKSDFYTYPEKLTSIDFYEFHEQLDKVYDYEEKKAFIIEAYVEICKTLMKEPGIQDYIPAANDFYVIAFDSSELNVEVYIDKVLKGKQRKKLLKYFQDERDEPPFSEEDYRLFTIYKTFAREKLLAYGGFKQSVQTRATQTLYSTELLFFLEPYRYDFHSGVLIEPDFHTTDAELNYEKPECDEYYKYVIEDDKLIYIARYSRTEEWRTESFFFYEKDKKSTQCTFNHFEGKQRLDEYITVDKGNPIHWKAEIKKWYFEDDRISELSLKDYILDEKTNIVKELCHERLWEHNFDVDFDITRILLLEHDTKGKISRIIHQLPSEEYVLYDTASNTS